MNAQEIIDTLQGKLGTNPERGIEADDLLANAFFELEAQDWPAFWTAFAKALQTLVADKDGLPVYLAARFMSRMAHIDPPRLPGKKSQFNFLLKANTDTPEALAGRLLALSVLNKGTEEFWMAQVEAALNLLESSLDETYAVAAVVHAFVECSARTAVPAGTWQKLFDVITHLPNMPRMELLNLLVGVEKETQEQQIGKLEEELAAALNAVYPSIKGGTEAKLNSVLNAWLELNNPHEAIAAWLRKQQKDKISPRQMVAASLAKATRPFISSPMQVAA